MAAIKVFHVNELLEAVLLNLPFRDMFKVKAVCKSWKELIDKSPQLKQAMFLAPSDAVIQRLEGVDGHAPENLPIALQRKSFEPLPLFSTTERSFHYEEYIPASWEHHTIESALPPYLTPAPVTHTFRWEIDEEKMLTVPPACRYMYLTQPPVVAVSFMLKRVASDCDSSATIVDKGGVTVGLIADVVHDALQQLPLPMRRKAGSSWPPYVCVGFGMPKGSEKSTLENEK